MLTGVAIHSDRGRQCVVLKQVSLKELMTGSEPVRADAAVLHADDNKFLRKELRLPIILLVPRIARFPHNRLATWAAQSEMRN